MHGTDPFLSRDLLERHETVIRSERQGSPARRGESMRARHLEKDLVSPTGETRSWGMAYLTAGLERRENRSTCEVVEVEVVDPK